MKTSWIKIVLLSFAFAAVPTMPSLAFQEKFDDSTGALEIIGDGTEVLGKRYWRGRMELRSVTISGIRGIEGADLIQDLGYDGAFVNCSNLLHVTFKGDSLESIGMNCFDHCVNLREIVIPDSVTHIGTSVSNVPNNGTFTHCYSVTNIVIGSGLPVIYDDQFRANFMTNLQSVTINGSGRTVLAGSEDGTLHRGGSGTFSGTTVRKVVLRGVASIGIGTAYSGAFSDCTNLTELVFADNCLTNISLGSFRRCRSLPCVTLPEGLQQLGRNAFFGCTSLTNIDFGTGTYSIDADVFQACTALKRADITANITSYGARGTGSIFSDCTNLTYLRVGPGVKTVTLQILPPKNAAPNEVLIEGAGDAVIDFAAFRDSNVRQVRLSGVKRIGDEAFARCQSLESVDFVDCPKLEYIGRIAFSGCPLLGTLNLPDTASTVLGGEAFRGCTSLTNFTFGSGTYGLYDSSHFRDCTALRSIRFANGVTNLPSYTLSGCTGITNVWIGSGVTSIGTGVCPGGTTEGFDLTIEGAGDAVIEFAAFRDSNVRQVRLSGVKRIGDEAFARCQLLESVAFGDCPKLEYIGKIAFSGCPLLGSVALPNSASTTIENQAFRGCSGMASFEFGTGEYRFEGGWNFASCSSLTTFTFTDGVKNTGSDLFYDCPAISNMVIGSGIETVSADIRPSNNSALVSVTVNGGGETVVAGAFLRDVASVRHVTLRGVKSIGDEAFIRCHGLETVTVTGDKLEYIGRAAFADCESLVSVSLPEDTSPVLAERAFYNCRSLRNIALPRLLPSIGNYAFYYCRSLPAVTVPDTVTNIGNYAFSDCTNLSEVVFGKGTYTLGDEVFSRCTALKDVALTATIPVYGAGVFNGCTGVTNLYVGSGVTNVAAAIIPRGSSSYWKNLHRVVIEGNGEAEVGRSAFSSGPVRHVSMSGVKAIGESAFRNCADLISVTGLDDSLTSIGDRAFENCDGLSRLDLPDSVETIGAYAFESCEGLSGQIALPAALKSLGESAFEECSCVEGLVVPSAVTNIGAYAFRKCSGLETLDFAAPSSLERIGEHAFDYCSSLKGVAIPDSVTEIGDYAFARGVSIAAVDFGKGTYSLGDAAFYGCKALKSVALTCTLTSYGTSVFGGCEAITDFYVGPGVATLGSGIAPVSANGLGNLTVEGNGSAAIAASLFANRTSLTNVVISGVTDLGDGLFSGCSRLANLNLKGDSLVRIGNRAFASSGLKTVTVPASVELIGTDAFASCGSLERIDVAEGSTAYASEDGVLFNAGKTTLIRCPQTKAGSYAIPASVTAIEDSAFYSCRALVAVSVPTGVEEIGIGAFAGCDSMTNISVEAGNAHYAVSGGVLYDKDIRELVCCPAGRTGPLDLPEGVTNVIDMALLGCCSLETVTLPQSLAAIGAFAFEECTNLVSMTFPESLASIGDRAFILCSSLTNVTFEGAPPAAPTQVFWSSDSVSGRSLTPNSLRGFYHQAYEAQWKSAMTYQGKWRNVPMTCIDPVPVKPGVTVVYDKSMGKVTGDGEYPAGKTVTLKATANKGYVFAGWYSDAAFRTPLRGSVDYRTSSYAYVVAKSPTTVYAKFVAPADDVAAVSFKLPEELMNGVTAVHASVDVSGCTSLPTVKVTGLPTGLKFTAKDVFKKGSKTEVEYPANTIYGTATKSGFHTVVVTVTTAGKKTASASQKVVVRKADEFVLDVACDATMGKATGAGVYQTGKSVTLKATANAAKKATKTTPEQIATVFAGWYADEGFATPLEGAADYRNPSFAYVMPGAHATAYAKFIAQTDDVAAVSFALPEELTNGVTAVRASVDVSGCTSLPTVKVTGLPTGLKFTAKDVFKKGSKTEVEYPANTIYGTATKSGFHTVVVTVTTAGKKTASASQKVVVRKANEFVLDIACDALLGKVTGTGVYAAGKKATLKATANKGYVFNGWYASKEAQKPLSQATSYSYLVGTNDVTLLAEFLATSNDWATVSCATTTVEYVTGKQIDAIAVMAEGGSLPTVKVAGLPTGLKFDAKLNVISGKPTKSGVYMATVTATTAGKATATATLKFIVRKSGEYVVDVDYDAAQGKVTGAGVYAGGKKVTLKATANKNYVFFGWWEGDDLKSQATSYVIDKMPTNDVTMAATFITAEEDEASIVANVNGLVFSSEVLTQATNVSCGVYLEWPVLSEALTMPTTVKVSGLPTGLKFKDGVISGTPTAASKTNSKGEATPSKVKVTVTSAGKSKQEFVFELTVAALPAWAVGTFNGRIINANVEVAPGVTNSYTGSTTFTVGSNGKISGTANTALGKITFSAASFDRVDENGWGWYWVNLQGSLTYNRKTVKVPFIACVQPPSTWQPTGLGGFICVSETDFKADAGKKFNEEPDFAIQNAWKSRKDLNYESFPTGSKPLSLTDGELVLKFDKDGVVKVSGKVPGDNETSVPVSCSAQVIPNSRLESLVYAYVEVFVAPKTNLADGFFKEYQIQLTSDGTKFVDVDFFVPDED